MQSPSIAVGGLACRRELNETDVAGLDLRLHQKLMTLVVRSHQEAQGTDLLLVEKGTLDDVTSRRRPFQADNGEETFRSVGNEAILEAPLGRLGHRHPFHTASRVRQVGREPARDHVESLCHGRLGSITGPGGNRSIAARYIPCLLYTSD